MPVVRAAVGDSILNAEIAESAEDGEPRNLVVGPNSEISPLGLAAARPRSR
jgi:hypothetical protein